MRTVSMKKIAHFWGAFVRAIRKKGAFRSPKAPFLFGHENNISSLLFDHMALLYPFFLIKKPLKMYATT